MAEKPKDLFDLESLSKESITDLSEQLLHEEDVESQDGEKYVVFQIEETNYAIPSSSVAEVVRMLPVTELPNVPEWFIGISNLRGNILSIIDLPRTWNAQTVNLTKKAKLVVLQSENSDSNLAFRVDRLREIAVLEDDQISEPETDNERHFVGTAVHKLQVLNVLNVPEIISSLRLR